MKKDKQKKKEKKKLKSIKLFVIKSLGRGTGPAHLAEYTTLDLGIVSSSPTLG